MMRVQAVGDYGRANEMVTTIEQLPSKQNTIIIGGQVAGRNNKEKWLVTDVPLAIAMATITSYHKEYV